MEDLIDRLQTIFAEDLCDGSWEHRWGFEISTLDNPSWEFRFDLFDTDLIDIPFATVKVNVDENNWFICRNQERKFEGFGGPKSLTDILKTFKKCYLTASEIADERKARGS